MTTNNNDALMEQSDEKRLAIYKVITAACTHLFSKGKLQEEKFKDNAKLFAELALKDPIFMVHFTAWAAKKDSKDMKVLSIFFNALNDANGTPFFKGSTKNKPNFREISYALLQELDPHSALRVLQFCHKKFEVAGVLNNSRHFPTGMKTAFRKYIHYREDNEDIMRGIKRAGLTKKMMQIYRLTRTAPSDRAAAILAWKQRDGNTVELETLPDFSGKSSKEITEILETEKLSPMVVMSSIPADKVTASVAKAMLHNCTGNQSIILYNWFARNGFLDVPAIKELFKEKIKESTTAIDRIDTLSRNADADDRKELAQVRSEKRKTITKASEISKIFMHIDASGSMDASIGFAKERASTIAECVNDPSQNFRWGLFGSKGHVLAVPKEFTKEDFFQALYGVTANMGQTDCIALYPEARRFGAEIDVYVTDQGHNIGTISKRINEFHAKNPDLKKPKAAVIIDFSGNRTARHLNILETELKRCEIPVAIIEPDALKESALVAQSVRAALVGELAIIEEIMNTKLPTLPKWWNSVSNAPKQITEVEVKGETKAETTKIEKKVKASKTGKKLVKETK